MQSFMTQLSQALLDKYGAELGETCVVFPSRRACAFMEASIGRMSVQATWSPALYAIEDFVPRLQQTNILDPISLTFELWPLYQAAFPHENFDEYYAWGQQIVADFNEVDQHLVDGNKIFQSLASLKRIDTTIEAWLNEDGELSPHQQAFMKFWESLGTLYSALQTKLKAQNMASPGQALRALGDRFAEMPPILPWRRVVFAGFNALSPAEERLILSLMHWELAECYWDLDAWYTENDQQEAGRFFRSLRLRWEAKMPELAGKWNWIGNHLATTPKQLTVTAVPKRVGQAKAAGLLLEEMARDIAAESLALVLPDENLLFPVLHSLPESLRDVNVTMGYPLRNTPLFGLVDAVITLHENAARLRPSGEGEPVYYFRDIVAILRHPYIHNLAHEDSRDTIREITQENRIYVAPGYFLRYEFGSLLRFLFEPWTDLQSAMTYLLDLYMRLKDAFEARQKTENPLPTVESEILFQFFSLTQKLQSKLGKYLDQKDLGTFRRIYKEVLVGASLPFSGEPLKGVQVMGMLETRVLDFERLIVLSVNESILPPKPQLNSLIPYSVRKAFGMPTFEDKDAVYAYHFYRLLQRAQEVQLIYDTEPDGTGGGEKSRFVAQIEAELVRTNPQIHLVHETFTFPAEQEQPQPIAVEKSPDLIAKLHEIGNGKGFSPSALNTYLNCTLQFYFRYVMELKEKALPEETMEDNTFGSVLHAALESLYEPLVGTTIQPGDIESLFERVSGACERAFTRHTHSNNFETGRNRLLLGVIKDLVRQMLDIDLANAPFELIGLEQNMEAEVPLPGLAQGFKVRGIVDRIDRTNGRIRIIDYKTGKVERLAVKDFHDLRNGTPKREVFQLGTYAYLYQRNHATDSAIYPGIFAMRNLSDGLLTLQYGAQKTGEFDQLSLAEFEGLLANIFSEILDLDQPFVQTEDKNRCRFCPYRVICNRV